MPKIYTIHDADRSGRPIEAKFSVPNGLWVAETSAYSATETPLTDPEDDFYEEPDHRSRNNQVMGPEPRAITLFQTYLSREGYRYWEQRRLLVGTEPFGVVTTETDGQGAWFTGAWQIHKNGEIGERPGFDRPQVVREAPLPAGEGLNRSGRRRGRAGWINLAELARTANLPVAELVKRYYAFTDSNAPVLAVLRGDAASVQARTWSSSSPEYIRLPDLTDAYWGAQDPAAMWVRAGWATAVLYMRHLGYVPELLSVPVAV